MTHPKYSMDIRWSNEDGLWIAACPEFGGGVSAHGDSAEGALRGLKIMIKMTVATYRDEEWGLPQPRLYPAVEKSRSG